VCLSYPYDKASNAVAAWKSCSIKPFGQAPDQPLDPEFDLADAAIRNSTISGDTFTQAFPNGGEYHTQMKLAAHLFHSTAKSAWGRSM
jgi:hypothetical protein